MKVIILGTVEKFINALDKVPRSDVYNRIDLLQQYGHAISMPYAKRIGNGMWELRRTGRPQIRILYGFCGGDAVLVLGLTKQRRALRQKEIELARKRLMEYCG